MALWGAGVLTLEESKLIEHGLATVRDKLAAGAEPDASDEDIHTMIDRMLHEEIGDVASKLHTGRSRNDQVATATRLWTMEACTALDSSIRGLQQVMVDHAGRLEQIHMPAYTHLQRAQPVSAAHWMLSHFWPLERDRGRLAAVARGTAVLPLGSGAVRRLRISDFPRAASRESWLYVVVAKQYRRSWRPGLCGRADLCNRCPDGDSPFAACRGSHPIRIE